MGNRNTKSSLRNAVIYLNISADPIGANDDKFWNQIWTEDLATAGEVIKSIRTQEIRMLRDGSPKNFSTLAYKMVERLYLATGTLCNTQSQQTSVMNATRLLARIIPCIFEDKAWQSFFIDNNMPASSGDRSKEPELRYPKKADHERNFESYLPLTTETTFPAQNKFENEVQPISKLIEVNSDEVTIAGRSSPLYKSSNSSAPSPDERQIHNQVSEGNRETTLMKVLIDSICDLLFCPEFTVTPHSGGYPSNMIDAPPEDLKSLSTCDYVWEPGVGFESGINSTTYYDKNRSELLRLLLACLSAHLYETPTNSVRNRNLWIEVFASEDNRHVLPLFTSLLNTIFIYNPSKLLPFNHLLFEDTRGELVELSIQILVATLDYRFDDQDGCKKPKEGERKNLFIEYMSRIHRSEDFAFIIKGFTRLLNNCLEQNYLPSSTKHINFDQELLILFWKVCDLNKRFITYLLKTRDVLDFVVPILYHLNENFQDQTKTALIHIGVFNLLILSGERNFGVRLNKPYLANVLLNLPAFTGSHADLLIIVFHKLILYGQNLNQLFDFLLTIIVNISPYLKALSILASKCLIQLFEIFSSPFVVLTEPNYHQLVVFLLEIFNNLIQYQFDGNANFVYTVLNKKEAFLDLANLPTTNRGIQKVLSKLIKKKQRIELIGKVLTEQSNQDKDNDQGWEHSRTLLSKQAIQPTEATSRQEVATVSAVHTVSRPNSQPTRQEVSLVATPDICCVTQQIHSFDVDPVNRNDNPASVSSFREPAERQMIDFDDKGGDERMPLAHTSATGDDLLNNQCDLDELVGKSNKPNIVDVENSQVGCEQSNESAHINTASTTSLAPKRWRPTPDWAKHWKLSLPLHTILRMIEVLTPQLDTFKQDSGQLDEIEAIKFLQNGTLVGLLPVPHPILIRKYRTNSETTLWFRACTWGIIYVRNTIWTDTAVRLVRIM